MGYAYYIIDGKECGYGVDAVCEHDGCEVEIHRGLAYACGDYPGGGDVFCDGYFCSDHIFYPLRDSRSVIGGDELPAQLCCECYGDIFHDNGENRRINDGL